MPKATAEVVEKVKAAHPGVDLEVVEHPTLPHDFIVKPPGRQAWNIYRQKNADPIEKVHAEELLFEACCVWPEKEERDRLVDRYPAMVNVVAGELVEIVGGTRSATHRKL